MSYSMKKFIDIFSNGIYYFLSLLLHYDSRERELLRVCGFLLPLDLLSF
jgi:hypothetical protein